MRSPHRGKSCGGDNINQFLQGQHGNHDYFVFRNHVVLIFPVLDGSLLDIIQ